MRALVLHPISNYNIGDLLTYRGTQEILRAVDPDIEFLMFDFWRAEKEVDTYMSQFYWGDVDVLVLAGSPWVWLGLEKSLKYKLLCAAVKRFKSIPKLALGVGSCFPLNFLDLDKAYKEFSLESASVDMLGSTLGQFNLVLTRDKLAQGILERSGVESFLSRDTAWWTVGTFKKAVVSDRPLCIFQNPTFSLTKNILPESYVSEFLQAQIDFVKDRGNAEVYAISSEDAFSAKTLGLEARFVSDLGWVAAHMTCRPEVLSGRVHMALLANIMEAAEIEVLPMDSRFLTLESFPRIKVNSLVDYSYQPRDAMGIWGKEVIDKVRAALKL